MESPKDSYMMILTLILFAGGISVAAQDFEIATSLADCQQAFDTIIQKGGDVCYDAPDYTKCEIRVSGLLYTLTKPDLVQEFRMGLDQYFHSMYHVVCHVDVDGIVASLIAEGGGNMTGSNFIGSQRNGGVTRTSNPHVGNTITITVVFIIVVQHLLYFIVG